MRIGADAAWRTTVLSVEKVHVSPEAVEVAHGRRNSRGGETVARASRGRRSAGQVSRGFLGGLYDQDIEVFDLATGMMFERASRA